MIQARITELQALNRILAQAGEQPVNGLTNIPRNASRALDTLREVTEVMQSDSDFWKVNTEIEKELHPDAVTGKIQVAQNVVSVSTRFATHEVTLRGDFLYDIRNATDIFTEPVEVKLKFMLEWDELPVQHRTYFQRVAARLYQQRWIANEKKHQFDLAEEAQARSLAMAVNVTETKKSMLHNPTLAFYNNRIY
ncbi:hypothetical protein CMI37_19795 [Candidatus Pacearchaeota archaeon]|nr:hypothetical protein [Candidatus Pacearchaeota archaeon]|tara:strand:+ start:1736 stop:2317 length:582 start_codon:yes stop_codon:yes gene_type:complete